MIEVNRHVLPNGLRIVHSRNTATQMAAVNLLYAVGSRNEPEEHTGMAHLLEHLMFGGSVNVPCFDRPMQDAGGENNAWTSNDITNYYEVLPVGNIETALWLESDRMRGLMLTDSSIEVQRSVVLEEFKQRCLNAPYGDVAHLWRSMVYKKHPYRWPVVGKDMKDIELVDRDTVKAFYDRYYTPDNAILAIVGNLTAERAFSLAEKWFGDIQPGEQSAFEVDKEPQQYESRVLHVVRKVPNNMIVKAYRMCGRKDKDYHVYDLLSDVLSNGRSSRLYRHIYVGQQLVSSIDASITGDLDDGVLKIKAQLLSGVSFDRFEEALAIELRQIMDGCVEPVEIEKNANRYESNMLFGNLNNDERASNIAYYEMLGDAQLINQEAVDYRSITPERLTEVAKRIFREDNCSTLYYEAE